jgi:WD40 repeat protein
MYTNKQRGLSLDLSKKMQVSSIAYEGYFPVFSPDGSCIASVEDKGVRIWRQSESGHQHEGASVQRNSAEVEDVVFSPDGQVVASTHKSCVKFWDTTTGTCLFTSEDVASSHWYHGRKTVVVSPNSAFAACQSVKRIWIFNINTRTLIKAFKMNHDADAIAVSSDGSRFVSLWSENKSLTLRDLENDEYLAILRYTHPYTNLDKLRIVFAPDGNSIFIDDHVDIHCLRIGPASYSQHDRYILAPPMAFIPVPECEWSLQDGCLPSSPYQYDAGGCWIMDHDGRHILWLPPDKRNVWSTGYHGKKMALGTRDEKVYIFDFSNILLS